MFALVSKKRFSHWVETHHQRLYRHALWMAGDRDLACDLVQETCYQAWKSRGQLRHEDRVLPWLLTILRRNALQELGRGERDHLPLGPEDLGADPSAEHLDALIDLHNGLLRLGPKDRDLLLLHALHGFSYREIGEQLQVPVGTVMSRLSRARARIRKQAPASADEKVIPISTAKRRQAR